MTQFIEVGGVVNGFFTRNKIAPISESAKMLDLMRQQTGNRDIYYCTYVFDKQDRSAGTKYISPLYFDIDGDISTDEGFEKIRMAALSLTTILCMDLRIKPNNLKYYFSGSKGLHIMLSQSVIGIHPAESLNTAYKAFVCYVRNRIEHGELLDTKIYDNKRLIRLANSINAKTGLYKIPVRYEELRTIRRSDLLKLASNPRQEYITEAAMNQEAATRFRDIVCQMSVQQAPKIGNLKIPDAPTKLPPCMKILLGTPIGKGGRNNMLALISSILIQNGYKEMDALGNISVWNAQLEEPLEEREILLTYNSAMRMAREGRGYGCSAIRQKGLFFPQEICPNCKIYKCMHER